MADSNVTDVGKMKVIDLRKELKSRGLPSTGDKAELVARLQAALSQDSQDDHGDINLDSDEIDSDGVLDDDEKTHNDLLDDSVVESLSDDLALAEPPAPASAAPTTETKPKTLKRKITMNDKEKVEAKAGETKEGTAKKIVLNRAHSITAVTAPAEEKSEDKTETKTETGEENNKIKITADLDAKTKLELRAKRFGLPVKITDEQRKEARKQRFGGSVTSKSGAISTSNPDLKASAEKLKQRAERFGQSVSKFMTDIENREKLEKRKAKFGTVK